MYKEYFQEFLDIKSPYYQKILDIILANANNPKGIIKNRNLHHIVPKFFWKKKGLEVSNDTWNLVSLSIGDHFLIHWLMDKCALPGWHKYTSPPWRMIIKSHSGELCKWISDDNTHVPIMAEALNSKKDEPVRVRKPRSAAKKKTVTKPRSRKKKA